LYQFSISIYFIISFWHKITCDYPFIMQKHTPVAESVGKYSGRLHGAQTWTHLRYSGRLNGAQTWTHLKYSGRLHGAKIWTHLRLNFISFK